MAESQADKKGILLETGTNEFEIVEFSIGEVNYGINVAKVREVITKTPVTKMPQAHPYIDGLFTLRGRAIPLVNLPRCLNVHSNEEPKNIIVTEINNYNIGFLVDNVSRIHRISWKDMEPAPEVGDQSRVVGIIKMKEKIVLLLDFETIIAEINPEINAKLTTIEDAEVSKPSRTKSEETLIYSAWRRCFPFFETVEDGRVHSCFKKRSRLAKRNNCAFPEGSVISAPLDVGGF